MVKSSKRFLKLKTKISKFIERFKYYLIKLPISKITLAREKSKEDSSALINVFLYWILDITGYAVVGIACAWLITSLGWIGVGLSFGMLRWTLLDLIEELKDLMKE